MCKRANNCISSKYSQPLDCGSIARSSLGRYYFIVQQPQAQAKWAADEQVVEGALNSANSTKWELLACVNVPITCCRRRRSLFLNCEQNVCELRVCVSCLRDADKLYWAL